MHTLTFWSTWAQSRSLQSSQFLQPCRGLCPTAVFRPRSWHVALRPLCRWRGSWFRDSRAATPCLYHLC